ncbi:bifunctional oligoribonuclease/PAP phosphatase NrnA [Thermodesulfobacteriota bacterium]
MSPNRLDPSKSIEKIEQLAIVLAGVGHRTVLVLTHNNPDPDTIGSAAALNFLLKKRFGVRSIIGYWGVVTRAENKAMIQRLRIEMTQITQIDWSEYHGVALVDAQPGTGNNILDGRGESPMIVIDHHPLRRRTLKAHFHDIRPEYGATSTILTEYLAAARLTPGRSVANALLYGIKADTNSLVRGASKADFAAYKYLSPLSNPRVIGWIERPPLPPDHFVDFHRALSRATLYRDVAVSDLGRVCSESIVPEIADLLLRIEGVCWSCSMGRTKDLLLISVRSTSRTYAAGDVMGRLVGRKGSAGGHKEMAGGQIPLDGLSEIETVALERKLVARFLRLINRNGCQPKLLVDEQCPV